jgi:hypothetical protein
MDRALWRRVALGVTVTVMVAIAAVRPARTDSPVEAQAQPQPSATAGSARAAAPIDLTGTWVSVVTEDWQNRMITPRKGDYESVPVTVEARKVADSWDIAKDEAAGLQCKPFGVGNIMRQPGRLRISWQDDQTLKIEFDAGTQTRLLHFDKSKQPGSEKTWQGHSIGEWETPGRGRAFFAGGGDLGRRSRGWQPRGGSLKVVTTNVREGYLRKNGIPYSENATVTEYFDLMPPLPSGEVWLVVGTTVTDPRYLTEPFLTSSNFKKEPDGSKWNPTPCRTDPPGRT